MMKPADQLNGLIFDAMVRLKEKDYWLNKLSGDLVKSSFPFDRSNSRKKTPEQRSKSMSGETLNFAFTGQLFSRLIRLSNKSDIRLYIILAAGMVLLLNKYTGSRDIIIGAPIYRQEVEGDFINKIVALRTRIKDEMSFKELLLHVSKTNSEAFENINYPLETLPYELNMSFPQDEFPLFDTAILIENIHDKSYIDHLNLNVVFSFLRTGESIKGLVEYNSDLYHKGTMERMIGHFTNLMQRVLTGIDSKIIDISILSEDETRQLIFDFNDTRADYPRDKTIHQLFEEQVENTPDMIAVVGSKQLAVGKEGTRGLAPLSIPISVTYRELNEKANQLARVLRDKGVAAETIAALLLDRSIEVITAILAVLKAGGAYLPLDIEYPADRINYILRDSETKLLLTSGDLADKIEFNSTRLDPGDEEWYRDDRRECSNLNLERLSRPDRLAYVIYTSGTTGKPKGVMIEHRAVVNYVCWAAKTYVRNESVNFPLYSSISFDLTVTSLFTPLLTGNTIVVYRENAGGSEGRDFLIEEIIDDNQVGVIKLTPSHLYVIKYKSLNQSDIRCFIVGGEELETRIAREINEKFAGKVEIYNEYGPTEATVGCVFYKFNPAEDNGRSVPIGVPTDNAKIYILDGNGKPVPLGVRGEIYISGDGVARGYLNSVELTAEKFTRAVNDQCPMTNDRWYRSGDLARWLPGGNMEYLGRADQQVKIRGYRVELAEIEQNLLQYEGIQEVVVIARDGREKSSEDEKGDPYLCAYFVSDRQLSPSQLREYLQQHLPPYMIPLFFVQLEEIPLTSNGKVDRRALPEPQFNLEQEYAAPRDEVDEKLVEIWSEVLRLDKERIGIDANFFELGGQSLKQVVLISKIHKELNVRIALAEIFKMPGIRALSDYIKGLDQEQFASLEKAEQKEYYPLALPQKRFYIFQQLQPKSITYNIPMVLTLEGNLEREKLEIIFKSLIQRHESLRTSFGLIGDEPVQKIHDHVEFEIEYYDLYRTQVEVKVKVEEGEGTRGLAPLSLEPASGSSQLAASTIKNFIRPFDLSRAPLLRVGLLHPPPFGHPSQEGNTGDKYILMVDMHHIITDGISERIMTEEFITLYAGKELPPLKFQYRDFSEWQNSEEQESRIAKQGEFWKKQFEGEIPGLKLLTDYPRPAIKSFAGSAVDFEISAEQTAALRELALQKGASLYMVLLAIYYILLAKLSGQEDIIVGTGVAGRGHADLMNIIGLMFNTIPVRSQITLEENFIEFLKSVKAKTMEAFENQEYPFDELVEELLTRKILNRDPGGNPLFDTMFALQNFRENTEFLPELRGSDLKVNPYNLETRISRFDLFLIGAEVEDIIRMRLEYSTALFKPSTAEEITRYYMEILDQVLENREIVLKDITISYSDGLMDLKAETDQDEYMDFGF